MRSRLILFDLVKLILAFLVVNLHVESFVTGEHFSYLYYLGWYAVPLFVAITFYFNAKHYYVGLSSSRLTSKLKRLLVPFVFWSVLGFIFHPELVTLKYILRQITMGTAVNAPLYYLLVVFWLTLLYYLVFKLNKNTNKLLIAVVGLSLLWEALGIKSSFAASLPIQIEFFVSRLVELVKYGALGLLVYQIDLTQLPKYSGLLLLLASSISQSHVYEQWAVGQTGLTYSGQVQFFDVMLIMLTIIYYAPRLRSQLLDQISLLGKYALGIYCLHSFFIDYIIKIGFTYNHFALSALIIISCILISLGIKSLSSSKLSLVVE